MATSVARWSPSDTSRKAGRRWSAEPRWGPWTTSGSSSRSLAASFMPERDTEGEQEQGPQLMPTAYRAPRTTRRRSRRPPEAGRRPRQNPPQAGRRPRAGDEPESARRHLGGSLRDGGVDPGDELVALGGIPYDIEDLQEIRIGEVRERLEARREAQVGRSDEEPVESGRRGDLPRGWPGPPRSRSSRTGGLLRWPLGSAQTGAERATDRPIATGPVRRVSAGAHERLGLVAGAGHRADHAADAEIEHAHQLGRIVPRGPDERGRRRSFDRAEDRGEILQRRRPVLRIDDDRVEACGRQDLSRRGSRSGAKRPKPFAVRPSAPDLVGRHGAAS